jgi:hypothetical protein
MQRAKPRSTKDDGSTTNTIIGSRKSVSGRQPVAGGCDGRIDGQVLQRGEGGVSQPQVATVSR